MNTSLLTLTASAVFLAGSMGLAPAQTTSEDDAVQGQPGQGMMMQQQDGMTEREHGGKKNYRQRMMRHHGMMGRGMRGQHRMGGMGQGGMGHGGMGHRAMMQVVFAIMDANGDGSLSLEEVQEAHARIFAHMDADDDGQVTKKEIKSFFHGGKKDRRGARWDQSDDGDDSSMSDDADDDLNLSNDTDDDDD